MSGDPGVGKSSVIELLKKNGYQTLHEIWTFLYEQAKENNRVASFLREKLVNDQLSLENALDKSNLRFLTDV